MEICPIEYAGHGRRIVEDFYTTISQAAEDVTAQIREKMNGDYVIYGHSMGGAVSFETVCLMEKIGMRRSSAV